MATDKSCLDLSKKNVSQAPIIFENGKNGRRKRQLIMKLGKMSVVRAKQF